MKILGLTGQPQIEQLRSQLTERLKSYGYEVEEKATIKGKSGAEHNFDILGSKTHGFLVYTMAIDVISDGEDKEVGLGEVFTFDDKCYDCGIQNKILIAFPGLNSVAARFAQGQQIKVFDKGNIETFLTSPLFTPPRKDTSLNWETKSKLLKSLTDLGYKVEENAKVLGKSDAEYTFDILAELDEGFIVHKLGIDMVTDAEVSLNQVSLFDTKAYDSGIREKVLC